jgi:hypothetical protein
MEGVLVVNARYVLLWYIPEVSRRICTEDGLGLARVNFFVEPVEQCLY